MKKLAKKKMVGDNETKFSREVSTNRYADNRGDNPDGEPKSGTLKTIKRVRPTITGGTKTTYKSIYNNDGPGGRSVSKRTMKTNSKGEITSMKKMGGSIKMEMGGSKMKMMSHGGMNRTSSSMMKKGGMVKSKKK